MKKFLLSLIVLSVFACLASDTAAYAHRRHPDPYRDSYNDEEDCGRRHCGYEREREKEESLL